MSLTGSQMEAEAFDRLPFPGITNTLKSTWRGEIPCWGLDNQFLTGSYQPPCLHRLDAHVCRRCCITAGPRQTTTGCVLTGWPVPCPTLPRHYPPILAQMARRPS